MTQTIPDTIKVMPDYHCFPLWGVEDPWIGDIDPAVLPIPSELKGELDAWARRYDETLNEEDPLSSGFASDAELRDFNEKGYQLASHLKRHLPKVRWRYFDVVENDLRDL